MTLLVSSRADSGERVVVIVNLSGSFLGKEFSSIFNKNISFVFRIANYRVPNIPANGSWHEWTFDYDVKVENNEVHLDIAEREAKILVWLGGIEPLSTPASEPAAESPPAEPLNTASQEPQPDSSINQNPQSTPSEAPSQ
jgi:hypothetical protein